ncbi:hypothetical protein BBF96_13320 [Anoxybacter fermentans]|uniref:ParB-like N-terminal domain-containing protein n=1 Tax=Anoxybacter fermentans TaxID=1323375 RepID=A0A3Q9HS12_9FIRM|nr:ParB/RepB/Spo0J family partition protein [Anoxybacter fermentans]AZR74296.1 hypothetical protein BBF96_13320 [Anoxybacter fermentans]
MSKKRLGKGLGALLPNDELKKDASESKQNVIEINVADIEPNPYQPRKEFDPELLKELSDSIKEHGVIQPISVRRVGNKYQLVAGERRLRATKMANLKTIPAIEKDIDDKQMMEIALIENLQREDLSPIEEAMAYKQLIEQFGLTQEEVSQKVSKSRSAIANTIRLLNLPKKIQDYVSRETLSMGHARALLGLSNEEEMLKVCEICLKQGFTVRQLEEYIKTLKNKKDKEREKRKDKKKDPEVIAIENRLKDKFGVHVRIDETKNRKAITIECKTEEELRRVIEILERS